MLDAGHLSSIRGKLGLPQEQMAHLLGVSFASVNRWEGGQSSPAGPIRDLYLALDAAIKGSDYENLDVLPADFTYRHLDLLLDAEKQPTRRLRKLLEPLAEEYDDIVLDCPPSMSLLSESVLRAADLVLVPLIPTTLSLRTMDQLRDFVAKQPEEKNGRAPQVTGCLSMIDRRRNKIKT